MGATCAPQKKTDEAPPSDMDKKAVEEGTTESLPAEKFTQIINQYQEENEKLKAAQAKMDEQNKAAEAQRQETTRKNDTLLEELTAMRAAMEKKDSSLLAANLQTALHTRATAMMNSESAAKLLVEGNVEKFGKAGKGSAKKKHVEVFLQNGQHTNNGFESGVIMMHYSESKTSKSAIRGRVLKVLEPKSVPDSYKGRTFSVLSVVEGSQKELVFACDDAKQRDQWVAAFNYGFKQIADEIKDMHEMVQLTIEFSKPKLGIRVEEKVIESSEEEAKVEETDKAADASAPAEDAQEKAEDAPAPPAADKDSAEKAAEEAEPQAEAKADAEAAPAEKDGEKAASGEAAVEEKEEEQERPCVLIVTAISDEELKSKGLCESMTLVGINDTMFENMVYSEQLELLMKTPKPYKLTFTGEKYLTKKTVSSSVTYYPEILKQLLAEERNNTQAAFEGIIAGTAFEKELAAAEDKNQLVKALLCDQRKLTALLTSVQVKMVEL